MRLQTIILFFVGLLTIACSPHTKAQTDATPAADTQVVGHFYNTPPPEKRKYPYDFVSVSDIIPDVVLDIRYYTSNNFVGAPIDGYVEPLALLSKPAADSLKAVADELRFMGYQIKIFDAYRPQKAVDHFMRWVADPSDTLTRQQFYPHVSKSRMVGRYIARRSAHSRGAAIDMTLVDAETGKEVDMGGTFDWFGMESHPSYCGDPNKMEYRPRKNGLTKKQFQNRMILRHAMTSHGFRAISSEWWHFSLIKEPYPRTYFNFDVKQP